MSTSSASSEDRSSFSTNSSPSTNSSSSPSSSRSSDSLSSNFVPHNPIHTDFLSRAAMGARDGFATLRALEALANDYMDLGYYPSGSDQITSADAVGTIDGLDPADLAAAVQGIAVIGDLMGANDGALRKAFKRLATFAR